MMDRDAILAAVAAYVPAQAFGRPVHAGGIRGAMQAVVHWALQAGDDKRLTVLLTSPSPDLIVRALRAGGWSRKTDLTPLLDDIEAGGSQLVTMYLDARSRAVSHDRFDSGG